jgi:VIT1/CCC1 family predicted Fe2+/Mn2+ transporter
MKASLKKGFGFGLTSGVITTLGLIIGLYSGTNSLKVVLGGIFVIAISDSMSDALGIHISEESQLKTTTKAIWEATISTFFSKFIIAIHFIIPFFIFSLKNAIIFSIFWGLSLIGVLSFYLAKQQKTKPYKVILEHVFIAVLVIIFTHYIGQFVASF